MTITRFCILLLLALAIAATGQAPAADLSPDAASAAMHKAVAFFRTRCGFEGGYVYLVSADSQHRQGESPVGPRSAWLEPPGTPAVGLAYLEAFRLTRDPVLLDAAKEAAEALIRTQLVSGGWDDRLELDPDLRKKYAFRVDAQPNAKPRQANNTSTFDDDKSQSAVRFLLQLDKELEFHDARLHEAARYALDAFCQAQYANGAWPQRYSDFPVAADHPARRAGFPREWPREFGGVKYTAFYTLNDGTLSDLIESLLDAWDVYQEPRYLDAAKRGGDFLLLAQLPEPQPGWAQQYDGEMHPVWARKFEPPALTGAESQGVLRSLMLLYRRTGDARYLEPIPRALAYYRKGVLPDGQLARFYELGTNKPLFFTKDYVLTYSDADMPTHYAFKVDNKLDELEREYQKVRETPTDKLWKPKVLTPPNPSDAVTKRAAAAAAAMDARGAWVERGEIRSLDGRELTTDLMSSKTFIRNLRALADYLGASPRSN